MGQIRSPSMDSMKNFVCLYGPEAEDKEWSPQFRYNLLDLRSHSTAISMPNGMGKTSLADAVIAVLSRDRTLVTQTREKMAPASCGAYSHIRVELKVPSVDMNNDLLVTSGQEIPGETWVFGACGFRGKSQSITFYHYKGKLGDCPVAKVEGHHITLMSNANFKQSRESVSGLRFGVPESDWIEAMTPHFPAHTLTQMANFQKNGGGDTASSIYNVNRKGNEKYHESFFYSVIAPELMSGAMSDEDDDGDEHYLESTFMKSGRAYIRAENETNRRKKTLERDAKTLNALETLSEKARKALELGEETQKLFAKISEEAGVINQLMKRRFVGIPFANEFPTGKIGDLARGIVVVPQVGPVIQDHVLAKILEKNTGHLNRDAMNSGVESTRISQPIEIIMDQPIHDQFSMDLGGCENKGYVLENAVQLLRDRDADVENLRSAFQWFAETVDTNPYRRESQALAGEISTLLVKIEDCKQKSGEAIAHRTKLQATITRIDSLKDAWQSLIEMGCFSDKELADPIATHELVKEQFTEAHSAVHDHERKVDHIKSLQAFYQQVVEEFGDDAIPGEILRDTKARLAESKGRLQKARAETEVARGQHKEAASKATALDANLGAATVQFENLKSLAANAEKFAELFAEESPDGLEQRVHDEKKSHQKRQFELTEEIKQTSSLVESLHLFRSKAGDVSPSKWIETAEERYREYVGQIQESERQQSDLSRRLNDLENEKVSASMASAAALEYLSGEGLSLRL